MARYCTLTTNKENSRNSFFNIYIVKRLKGETLYSNIFETATSSGYEIYSRSGSVGSGPVKIKYLGFSFALVAAERKAERIKQKKVKIGYTNSLEPNGETFDLSPTSHKEKEKVDEIKNEFPKLFDKLPDKKQEMTLNQKTRFESLLE